MSGVGSWEKGAKPTLYYGAVDPGAEHLSDTGR
jgi:hypothetical protein